jgi:hypothetical protein
MISVLVTAVAALSLVFTADMAGAADTGYTCLIEPFQRIELRSPVEARIHAMHVDRGSEVRKGKRGGESRAGGGALPRGDGRPDQNGGKQTHGRHRKI